MRAELSLESLWISYFSHTGEAGPLEVEAYLNGLMPLSAHQHDILAYTVNARLDELGLEEHVPYLLMVSTE